MSVESHKQLARRGSSDLVKEDDEFELLLRPEGRARGSGGKSSAKTRFVFHSSMFAIGLAGTAGCLWAMLYTSHSEEVAINMGLHRVANSLDNILSLLAYPVLMFTVILTLYAGQQLYRLYKEVTTIDSPRLRRKRQSL